MILAGGLTFIIMKITDIRSAQHGESRDGARAIICYARNAIAT